MTAVRLTCLLSVLGTMQFLVGQCAGEDKPAKPEKAEIVVRFVSSQDEGVKRPEGANAPLILKLGSEANQAFMSDGYAIRRDGLPSLIESIIKKERPTTVYVRLKIRFTEAKTEVLLEDIEVVKAAIPNGQAAVIDVEYDYPIKKKKEK